MFRFMLHEAADAAAAAPGSAAPGLAAAAAAAALPDAVEAAPEPPAEPAPLARGVRRGLRVTRLLQAAFAKGAKKAKTVGRQLNTVVRVANPTVAQTVCRTVFGLAQESSQKTESALTLDPSATITISRKRQNARYRARGAISYVRACRRMLKDVVADSETIIHAEVFDDCTMWLRQPLDARSKAARRAQEIRNSHRRNMKGKVPGKNVAMPILNCVQHVLFVGGGDRGWSGMQLHSPAQALPRTNWATQLNRKRRWSLCTAGEVGCHLDDDGVVQKAVDQVPTIIKLATNDAAKQNGNISRNEQDGLIARRRPDRFRAHLDVHCAGATVSPTYFALTNLN